MVFLFSHRPPPHGDFNWMHQDDSLKPIKSASLRIIQRIYLFLCLYIFFSFVNQINLRNQNKSNIFFFILKSYGLYLVILMPRFHIGRYTSRDQRNRYGEKSIHENLANFFLSCVWSTRIKTKFVLEVLVTKFNLLNEIKFLIEAKFLIYKE